MSCCEVSVQESVTFLNITFSDDQVSIISSPVTELKVDGEVTELFIEEIFYKLEVSEEAFKVEVSEVGLRGEQGPKGDPGVFCFRSIFEVSDWVLNAGRYELDVTHSLNSTGLNVEIWENEIEKVESGRIEILSQDTLRLFVPFDPDCRFRGEIIITAC